MIGLAAHKPTIFVAPTYRMCITYVLLSRNGHEAAKLVWHLDVVCAAALQVLSLCIMRSSCFTPWPISGYGLFQKVSAVQIWGCHNPTQYRRFVKPEQHSVRHILPSGPHSGLDSIPIKKLAILSLALFSLHTCKDLAYSALPTFTQ